ncbi:ABC-2 family transporter protein [Phycisphaerae bacterium RAS1]|nr:ABC-2 family transporter protein [Phycisphaerae bacterium RAS1]
MLAISKDLTLWLWRLLPANPILVRVVATGGKRVKHLWARVAYLAVLFFVMIIAKSGATGGGASDSLAELAKSSSRLFFFVSLAQLVLMSFIAPIFCAGAITQEKDANTFHILLTTPLTNGQIVLGSLFSRIYFVWVLLLSGLPIFCITMIYGGVTPAEVFQSVALAAATGLVTGSIAIMISFLKVGTRRTIFSFFVGIAVYLIGVAALGFSTRATLAEAPLGPPSLFFTEAQRMSWLAPFHPLLALLVVTGQTPPPDPAAVAAFGWPVRWLLAYPQYGYVAVMTAASIAMVFLSLLFVRSGAREGESRWLTRLAGKVTRSNGERRRKPRRVGSNPIAWREEYTRASAGGRSAMRWVFMAGGLIAGALFLAAAEFGWWGLQSAKPATIRFALTALIWIELTVILLVVTNTAASSLTREKESQTMELLTTTPLTSRYIVWGILQGLMWFIAPLLIVPALTLAAFVAVALLRGKAPAATIESVVLVPALITAFASLAAMIGLHFSLRMKKTVQAVMVSTVIVIGAAGVLWGCGGLVSGAGPIVSAVVMPFLPFPATQALMAPADVFSDDDASATASLAGETSVRLARMIFSIAAVAAYLVCTYVFYTWMVREYDMIVRRQSN